RLIESRVIPARPKVVAYYCGSNDIDAGDSAVRIAARIRLFIDKVTKALPETRVVFVDVNPVLANADGSARTEVFMNDRLHLRPPAYEEFAKILKPVLTEA